MSSEYPKYIERATIIKERSPLLSGFLSLEDFSLRSQMNLNELSKPVRNQADAQLGDNWSVFAVHPQYSLAEKLGLLNENLSLSQKIDMISSLNLIGYEVGNSTDLSVVLSDIDKTLEKLRIFSDTIIPVSVVNDKRYPPSQNFVHEVLKNGVFLRGFYTRESKKVVSQLPESMKNFIDELDLDDF